VEHVFVDLRMWDQPALGVVAIALLASAIRRRRSSNRRLRHSAYVAGVGNEIEFIAGVQRQWQWRTGKPIAPDELDRVLNLGWHDEE
jgi:hypothetical protein